MSCVEGKDYIAYHRAIAHLLRVHFNPKGEATQMSLCELLPMSALRPWIRRITVSINKRGSEIREPKDIVNVGVSNKTGQTCGVNASNYDSVGGFNRSADEDVDLEGDTNIYPVIGGVHPMERHSIPRLGMVKDLPDVTRISISSPTYTVASEFTPSSQPPNLSRSGFKPPDLQEDS
jgi:hypothetical protein